MPVRHRASALTPSRAAAALVRLAFVERGLAHICAGWAVKVPAIAAKLELGIQLHRSMERATLLRSRVSGLCFATAESALVPAGWRDMMAAVDRAREPVAMLNLVYGWLYPRLIALYREHARATDPIGDRASVELVDRVLLELAGERRRGMRLAGRVARSQRASWLRAIEAHWERREEGTAAALDEALWAPVERVPAAAREEGLRFSAAGSLGVLPADPVDDPGGVAMFLHKEFDEEVTTLELVARNSYEHPGMPWRFHQDMARQASDEARHALLIGQLMAARGVRHGDYPVSTSSYDGLYEFAPCPPGSRQELLWRLLIRQTFEEGLALDNLAFEIERRRAAGQADIAHALDYILRDEVFHAASGLRWSRELLGSDEAEVQRERAAAVDYLATVAEAAREAFVMDDLDAAMGELKRIEAGRRTRGGRPPERPLNRTGRAQAGYRDDDIAQVVEWGFASDAPQRS